ncbi:N-acetylmuramoyl-L-alanine amidase [uncultured Holdemanella sp.]|uniref:N-acetylmuramoyl-L-alanine amidase n=1 Tax=uncultured Holdemanella sp. TaxID=1763549 RepID=UPI00344C574E
MKESAYHFSNDKLILFYSFNYIILFGAYYSTNRGLLNTNETPLYVVKNNKVDAILIEAGFISDDSDLYYLKNHTKNIATAIAKGIKKSLN